MTNTYPQTWQLDSLLPRPDSTEFRARLNQLKKDLEQLAQTAEALPLVDATVSSAKTWADFFNTYAIVDATYGDFRAFIECRYAEDAASKLCQQLHAEIGSLISLRDRIAVSIEYAVRDVAPAVLKKWTALDKRLSDIEPYLEFCRMQSSLRLPRSEQRLASELGIDGLYAWGRLYDRLSGGLRVSVMERGDVVEKSPGQVHFSSPQRSVRENNFYAVKKSWEGIQDTAADAINHIAGSRLTVYRRLNLKDHLEAPLRQNRMTRETLATMLSAVSEGSSVLGDYFKTKARLLGVEKLSWWDIDAPLPSPLGFPPEPEIGYDEACERIVTAFDRFSTDLGDFGRLSLKGGWVEAANRPGKHQGGFCTGFPTARESRIFMTFIGTGDSQSTLAHELGHAYHSWILRDQPYFLRDYPMNLAETASTFAEAVLADDSLSNEKNDYRKLCLLDGLLGDAVAFLMNIPARFHFEHAFHQERASGEVSATRLSELMVEAQKNAYRNELADDGWNPFFWISKQHFYITEWPFYNFPYTFGYLLSLGTYAVGKEAGPGFADTYRKLLIATGNQNAEEAVSNSLGYDLRKPDFWNKSIKIVADRVQQFCDLANRWNG